MTGRAGILVLATAGILVLETMAAAASDPAMAILDQARGTPAEIFTDVAFRLLDAGKIPEKGRVALLDEVFLRANGAREPLPTRPADISPPYPSSGETHLDGLSIKCRVVKAMLAIDGKHARELFTEIARPHVPKPDCKAAILADPTVYFDTLAEVVTKAPFTAEEQKNQVPFWMTADAVRGIETSIEIVAAARNLSQLVHTEKEALVMSTAFASALTLNDCDRNFTAATHNSNLVDAVLMASEKFARLGAPPQSVQAALRAYLVRHLSASRCEDSVDNNMPASLALFRQHLAVQTAIQPISEEESKPSQVEGLAERTRKPDQDDYIELSNDVAALSVNGPEPAEVEAEVEKVLAKLRDWQGSPGQDAIDVFHRKARLYYRMLGPRVNSGLHREILSGLMATLEDSAILDASPADWLAEIRGLERVTMHFSNKKDAVPEDNAQAMNNSSISALQVYGKLAVLDR
jgi:hypothetical protein